MGNVNDNIAENGKCSFLVVIRVNRRPMGLDLS